MQKLMKYRVSSCRTARSANGSKLPDRGFVQVLARVNCALNLTDSGNNPAEYRNILAFSPPLLTTCITGIYKRNTILLRSCDLRDRYYVRMSPERFFLPIVNDKTKTI